MMPKIGDIQLGNEVGYKNTHKYQWRICPFCEYERWVQMKWVGSRCRPCANKQESWKQKREKSACWKGGRTIDGNGYMNILLELKDFFSSMADKKGYVLEHRLVMAKHLGRCLHSWEIVHHKNGIRNDNRLENLQLVSDDRHKQITILENRIKRLEARVTLLEAENILLKSEKQVFHPAVNRFKSDAV